MGRDATTVPPSVQSDRGKGEEGFSGYARAITTQYYVTPLHLSNKTGATCAITLQASLYVQYGKIRVVNTKLVSHA